ncbi:Protein N-acetyltransferase, RimJ/RimL family [Faunimonas pinastri]|uniref:Protein N-acetyltransferase, RimJ/RimL family n=1 Tax=Faunimonas pinastri TaxID=1855383 RepID=A0A1H9MJT8_9HYPH|nr:GNAT family N-acetyltransferase [Faunimonas pinastri]SER23789.1 Protein N-acetyltransferase, RimJ/RimL family [Faunimonas pinastri]
MTDVQDHREIRTARLLLRRPAPDDAEALHRFASDLEIARMLALVPHPLSRGHMDVLIRGQDDPGRSAGDFLIEADGETVGVVTVKRPGYGTPPRAMPRLGYWIGRPFWGRGYASEAVAAIVDHAFRLHPSDRIGAGVYHDNAASMRILEKRGFREAERSPTHCLARGLAVETVNMLLTREEYEGRNR